MIHARYTARCKLQSLALRVFAHGVQDLRHCIFYRRVINGRVCHIVLIHIIKFHFYSEHPARILHIRGMG